MLLVGEGQRLILVQLLQNHQAPLADRLAPILEELFQQAGNVDGLDLRSREPSQPSELLGYLLDALHPVRDQLREALAELPIPVLGREQLGEYPDRRQRVPHLVGDGARQAEELRAGSRVVRRRERSQPRELLNLLDRDVRVIEALAQLGAQGLGELGHPSSLLSVSGRKELDPPPLQRPNVPKLCGSRLHSWLRGAGSSKNWTVSWTWEEEGDVRVQSSSTIQRDRMNAMS